MQTKLLGIINVDFDVIYRLPTINLHSSDTADKMDER
jgi:hypothetical protein